MGEKVEWIWWGKVREITGCRVENELCSGRPEPQHRHLLAMTQLRGPFIQALGLEDLPRAAPTFLEVAHAPLGHDADPLGNISSFPLHTSIIEILWAQPARKVNPTIQRARSLKTHHAKKKKKIYAFKMPNEKGGWHCRHRKNVLFSWSMSKSWLRAVFPRHRHAVWD